MSMAVAFIMVLAVSAAPDTAGPVINHTPVAMLTEGAVTIEAIITDPAGVFDPTLLIRPAGPGDYTRLPMTPSTTPNGYAATVPPALVAAAPLEYFIEVFDNLGNGPSHVGDEAAPLLARPFERAIAPAPGAVTPMPTTTIEESSPWPVVFAVTGAAVGVVVLGVGGVFAFYALRPGDIANTKLVVTGPSPVVQGVR